MVWTIISFTLTVVFAYLAGWFSRASYEIRKGRSDK